MTKRRSFLALSGMLLFTNPLKILSKGILSSKNQSLNTRFFRKDELENELAKSTDRYLPFLNVDKLRTGLYVLPKGAEDKQQPHAHDEVYYILNGKGKFIADNEVNNVKEGAVLYVKSHIEHRFYDIEEELKILVFFSNMA